MQITVHGTVTPLEGKERKVGKEAPAAKVRTLDAEETVIGMIAPETQLLIAIPSLKTEVCSLGAKKFNTLLAGIKKLKTVMVTTDDDDFLREYVQNEGIENATVVIDTNGEFATKFGLRIGEGKLKGRLARACFVIDKEGMIVYKEIVPEITDEIDYDRCMEAVTACVNFKSKGHAHENWMRV
jgi:thiol peroxidase